MVATVAGILAGCSFEGGDDAAAPSAPEDTHWQLVVCVARPLGVPAVDEATSFEFLAHPEVALSRNGGIGRGRNDEWVGVVAFDFTTERVPQRIREWVNSSDDVFHVARDAPLGVCDRDGVPSRRDWVQGGD